MKSVVKSLYQGCANYPLNEKIMVVDTYQVGEQILEVYISEGFPAINLKIRTVYDLAQEIVEMNTLTDWNMIEPVVAEQILYTLLKELKDENRLNYFSKIEITPSFTKSIYSTIMTLRFSGYSNENFPFDSFISKDKATDLHAILAKYESYLVGTDRKDKVNIFQMALNYVKQRDDIVFFLQSNLSLTLLEEEFLRRILSENTSKLSVDLVRGLNLPEKSNLQSTSWGESTSLSYLYDLENAKGVPNLNCFTAKTEELELKEVLRRIKASSANLDETVIYYTNRDAYVTLLSHLSQTQQIPITFGEGLPIHISRPGRLMSGLVTWIRTNYSVQSLVEILQEGLLDFEENAPKKTKIIRYLRDLNIGWGKERYMLILEDEINRLKYQRISEEEQNEYLKVRLNELTWLLKWIQTIFKHLPDFGERMNYENCLRGLAFMLKSYCTIKGQLHDDAGKTALLEVFEQVVPFTNDNLSIYEVFERVNDLLQSVRIQQSKPKPNHLHASLYRNGVYGNRENIYIVGLNNRHFPGGAKEDPLLLDEERLRIGRNIPILRNSGQENLYVMLQLLAHAKGEVTVSYCHFDVNDNRSVSPAHLFLQCYRYSTGNIEADFKELKTFSASLISEDIMEKKDYWFQKLVLDDPKDVDLSLLEHYENLLNGLEAEKSRLEPQFTEYDGLIQIDEDVYDPRLNKKNQVSAAKLELLAKCSYAYYLHDVLGIRPVEEFAFHPYKWLDPATRGSLLHSIFEGFYKAIPGETPSVQKHEQLLQELANILIQRQREIIPPPNERIFNKEVKDILDCCNIFLKEEEAHCQFYNPLHFEYSFGLDGQEPAVLTLPSGATIHVAGKIDRVDQSADGYYHIIDYKTGSTYDYKNNQIFKGGRQLQHMLYALAIEQHLDLEEGKVQESAYYFPTVKGMAARVVRKQDQVVRENGLDILERLIDLLRTGTFAMTNDVNDCKFCDFQSVCRRQFYDSDVLEMKQTDNSKESLKRYLGVKAYE
ncbi:PD-(D/E)XK nuclease family protein [Robertmurraya massiliosenegalensis]|uniref:PD-(D/E)XK nuclease family protein n=1 Tax=Robertmurraya TaxID=2837507 RepID=UPI0039A5F66F